MLRRPRCEPPPAIIESALGADAPKNGTGIRPPPDNTRPHTHPFPRRTYRNGVWPPNYNIRRQAPRALRVPHTLLCTNAGRHTGQRAGTSPPKTAGNVRMPECPSQENIAAEKKARRRRCEGADQDRSRIVSRTEKASGSRPHRRLPTGSRQVHGRRRTRYTVYTACICLHCEETPATAHHFPIPSTAESDNAAHLFTVSGKGAQPDALPHSRTADLSYAEYSRLGRSRQAGAVQRPALPYPKYGRRDSRERCSTGRYTNDRTHLCRHDPQKRTKNRLTQSENSPTHRINLPTEKYFRYFCSMYCIIQKTHIFAVSK